LIGDSHRALGNRAAARASWQQSMDIIGTLPPHMLATAGMAELADDPESKPA
jgi:hypothetical protein